MTTMTALRIGLEVHCSHTVCTQFAHPLYEQLREGYEECAVLPLEGVDFWRDTHRTARKRADRAYRRGYHFEQFRRERHARDIYEINTSAPIRQGRPMSAGYLALPSTSPLPAYPCPRHRITSYGILKDSKLLAYMMVYRAGDLALVSQILGHADHLENEIMYLLVEGVVRSEPDGLLVYNRYDSGTEGLRFFKDRCGFVPTRVEWSQW